jgi:hypothetical protein
MKSTTQKEEKSYVTEIEIALDNLRYACDQCLFAAHDLLKDGYVSEARVAIEGALSTVSIISFLGDTLMRLRKEGEK